MTLNVADALNVFKDGDSSMFFGLNQEQCELGRNDCLLGTLLHTQAKGVY